MKAACPKISIDFENYKHFEIIIKINNLKMSADSFQEILKRAIFYFISLFFQEDGASRK